MLLRRRGATTVLLLLATWLTCRVDAASKAVRLVTKSWAVNRTSIAECTPEGVVSCYRVSLDFSAAGADSVVFPPYDRVMEKRHDLGDDTYEYEDVSDGSSAIITMEPSEGAMAVQINLGEPNKLFNIEACSLGSGCHVLKEMGELENQARVDSLHLDPNDRAWTEMTPFIKPENFEAEQRSETVISVNFYWTDAFEASTSQPITWIKNLVGWANTVYANSGVNIVMRPTCFQRLPGLVENNDAISILKNFRNSKNSDNLLRNGADIALLVLSKSQAGSCGIAFVNGYKHKVTLGWVAKGCQNIVVAHEVGHMFGAAHNKEKASFTPDGEYAYGLHIPPKYVSVMAYVDNAKGYTQRIAYLTGANVRFGDIPTGRSDRDVAKAHILRKSAIAGIGSENQRCPTAPGPVPTTTAPPPGQTAAPTPAPTEDPDKENCNNVMSTQVCSILDMAIACCEWAICKAFCRVTCDGCGS